MTATLGQGGGGKSSKKIVEALAMVTGRPLLEVAPKERLRVWLICYEDPLEEMERRIAAVCLYFGISKEDIGDRLLVDSGRDHDFVIVRTHGRDTSVVEPIVAGIIA